MNDRPNHSDPTSRERALRAALAGRAATVEAVADPDRLRSGLGRVDRLRVARNTGTAAVLSTVVVLGFFVARSSESSSPADVAGLPRSVPEPTLELPLLDDASTESADLPPASTTAPTTTAPPAPTTTAPPAPTTTAPPAPGATTPTAPPATAPTTTAPPAPAATTPTAPPATAPTTTAPPAATTFSASARYGSCEEDPPYDEYSGTAAPGATITVTSAWNAPATTVADGAGSWHLRVEFPSAPVGVPFEVTVSDATTSHAFDFVRTA